MSNYAFSVNVRVTPVASADYTTLALAFEQINLGTHGDDPVLTVMNDFTEPAPATLNAGGYTTLLITTDNNWTVFSGNYDAPIITFNNADRVTIDGNINQINSLTLLHTSVNISENFIGCINFSNGSSNCIVRYVNMHIPGNTSGRILNIALTTSAGNGNNDILVEFCFLWGGSRGLQTFGTPGIAFNERTIFSNNSIVNASRLSIFLGSHQTDAICEKNRIYNTPIPFIGSSYRSIGCQGLGNIMIRENLIFEIQYPGVPTIFGIDIIPVTTDVPNPPPSNVVNVINNSVALMKNNIGVTNVLGIAARSLTIDGAPYTLNCYNNTCRVGGTDLTTAAYNAPLYVDMEILGSTANIYNNLAINTRFSAAGSTNIGLDLTTFPFPGIAFNSDYNHAYAIDIASGNGWDAGIDGIFYRGDGGLSKYKETVCALFPGDECHTMFKNVNFINATAPDLAPVGGDMCGKYLAAVTNDIYINPRDITYPYKGAFEGPAMKVLTLSAKLEGVINSDQVTVVLKDAGCNTIASCTADLDGTGEFCFGDLVANLTNYYIVVRSRNHLTTSSEIKKQFLSGLLSYDFRDLKTRAYGDNMILDGGQWSFYGGEVTGDGYIDLTDIVKIENDSYVFLTGCKILSDINNDGVVDVSDISYVDNNSSNFIAEILPCPESTPAMINNNTEKKSAPANHDLRKIDQNASGY